MVTEDTERNASDRQADQRSVFSHIFLKFLSNTQNELLQDLKYFDISWVTGIHAEVVQDAAAQDFMTATVGLLFLGLQYNADLVFCSDQRDGDMGVRDIYTVPLSQTDHFVGSCGLTGFQNLCRR